MASSKRAVHRTILIVDVEGFGDPRRKSPHQVAIRDGLYRALQEAFRVAGIPWHKIDHEDRGDGVMILAPAEIPKAQFVEDLPGALVEALEKHNAGQDPRSRIRLRMVLHAGEIHADDHGFAGASLNFAFRLLDATPVKAALAESRGVLVLIASGWFYDDVVCHSETVDSATYRPVPVRVKETTATGWVARPDDPYPPHRSGRPVPRPAAAARAIAVVAVSALLVSWLAADGRTDRPAVGAAGVRIGGDYPHEAEFVAKLVSRKTGKCVARNGAYSHPDNSERLGEDIYQWDCAGSDNPGHTLVLAPLADGWIIRSSIRADLCLAADGAPGQEQHFQRCDPRDDRQQWRLRRVGVRGSDTVLVENRNTGMCMAPQDGDPGRDIQIFQSPCTAAPDGAVEWTIERYPSIADGGCGSRSPGRLRNHESGLAVAAGDPPTLGEAGPLLALRPARKTAHGCARFIVGPDGSCLGLALAGPASSEVRWQPCQDRPVMEWVVENLGEASGLSWTRIHSGQDLSQCLQPETKTAGALLTVRRCAGHWLQQWHTEPS
ncbi:MAG TPA: ricin-type beta-trefoil lectin domain protein [Actinophytocola sp.]|uniref:ricin-type beta-trefoil lectin domain protein n=1 Tax=Actinophytocola sp. TaxID=1872138 RepID=UPI002DDCAC09|nr:ricin-type beta-trefoil lectin domain protein [Actinophytocola sp.]HEV2781465.1 ricin-type beta-trefoil lectin domain protein [Actinophytocola sp.]